MSITDGYTLALSDINTSLDATITAASDYAALFPSVIYLQATFNYIKDTTSAVRRTFTWVVPAGGTYSLEEICLNVGNQTGTATIVLSGTGIDTITLSGATTSPGFTKISRAYPTNTAQTLIAGTTITAVVSTTATAGTGVINLGIGIGIKKRLL